MLVGFQFKHVLQLVVWICLDCQILQHFAKITKLLLVQSEFAASFGWQVAQVILAHASSGLCLKSGFSCGFPMLSTLFHCLHLPGPIE